MKLNQFRFFAAVYEEGSITLAAQREHATQSGISMQIKDLESRLGVQLFNRTSAGVKPTVPGDRLYARVTRILQEFSEIRHEFDSMLEDGTVELHVGLMPTFTRAILAPALVEFSQLRPHTRVKVTEAYSGYLTEEVTHQRLDLAIVPGTAAFPGLSTRYLGTDSEFLLTTAATKRRQFAPVNLRDELDLQIVVPGETNARRTKIDTYLATHGILPGRVMELDAMMGTLDIVARSDWVTILPGVLCAPDRDGLVRKIHPIAGPPLTVDYVLIESATRTLTPTARLLVKLIETEMNLLILEAAAWKKRRARAAA
ncbi:MAG: LysR family transcriptional regulator [Hyphomicrobiaceae bacterium]